MKRIITLLLLLTLSEFATAQLSYDNETFSYNGFNVNHYGLWWYPDPATSPNYGPMAYLTAFGGIKFFTVATPRAILDVNGNFGIGTMSPGTRLQVVGTGTGYPATSGTTPSLGTVVRLRDGSNLLMDMGGNGASGFWFQTTDALNLGLTYPLLLNPNGGNVGIGTTTPTAKFQVKQSLSDFLIVTVSADIGLNTNAGGWARSFRVVNTSGSNGQDGGAFGVMGAGATPTYAFMAIPTSDPTGYDSSKILILDNSGNVDIATTNTKGYKLAVNGSAIATSMTVKLLANWPDYVFKKDYQLPSLTEVKSYIDQNHHLPDMPSEAEVAKEGINLGEINKRLTKKVEELTLYLIDKDQENKELRQEVKAQQEAIALIKKQLETLTKSLNNK